MLNTRQDISKAAGGLATYGFGKPVQPLTGAFQEKTHQILEVRWLPPRADDNSKSVDLSADRNVITAAERALFACRTEERALVSVLDMVFDQTDWGPMVASRIRVRLKNDLERWFTDLNAKAEQSTPRTPSSVDSRWPSVPMPATK